MEQSGDAMATNRAKPSAAAREDRLSSLRDEVLVLILLRFGTAAAAGRTSVLSRRVWALLPELRFPAAPSPHTIASALAAHDAEAALGHLLVEVEDAAPESVAAWLPAAARRLSGTLVLTNRAAGANHIGGGLARSYADLLSLHRFVTQASVAPTVATYNLLLQAYCDCRRPDVALEHFRLLLKDDSPVLETGGFSPVVF